MSEDLPRAIKFATVWLVLGAIVFVGFQWRQHEAQKATFRERAVPVPGGVVRQEARLENDARNDIPSTVIAAGFPAAEYRKAAAEHPEWTWLGGLLQLRNVTYVDLPTSHWPMWSKPAELAEIIADVATRAGDG